MIAKSFAQWVSEVCPTIYHERYRHRGRPYDFRFLHWSPNIVTEVWPATQKDPACKPQGFWFSVGNGTDGWLALENYRNSRPERYQNVFALGINMHAPLLFISSEDDLRAFSQEFQIAKGAGLSPDCSLDIWRPRIPIDWRRIARDYCGIVIAPHMPRSFAYAWYDGWDVASGCIWDPRAVQTIRSLDVKELFAEFDKGQSEFLDDYMTLLKNEQAAVARDMVCGPISITKNDMYGEYVRARLAHLDDGVGDEGITKLADRGPEEVTATTSSGQTPNEGEGDGQG